MKSNILFFLYPFRGHTIQALEIIRNLFNTGEFNIIVDIGSDYIDLLPKGVEGHNCLYKYKSKKNLEDYSKDTLIKYGEGVLSTVEKYRKWYNKEKLKVDIICFDSLAFWGKVLADENNIPSVALHTIQPFDNDAFDREGFSYLQPYTNSFSGEREFKRIIYMYSKISSNKYRLPFDFLFSDLISSKGDKNIILVPDFLCKYKEKLKYNCYIYNPVIQDKKSYVGENDIKCGGNEKIIYISTGSIIRNKDFLIECIEQCKRIEGTQIYVSAGEFSTELKKKYKGRNEIKIYSFSPQISILKKAKLFITHGGMNSICESIYYETPMLVIPFMNDEYLNARMVEKSGMGIMLDSKKVSTKIFDVAKKMLNDIVIFNNIRQASKQMKSIDTINCTQDIFRKMVSELSSKVRE